MSPTSLLQQQIQTAKIKTAMVSSGITHLLAGYASKNPSAPTKFMALPSHDEMEIRPDDFDWVSHVGCF